MGSAPVLLHRLTYPSEIPASLDRGRRRPLAPAQPEPPSPTRIPPRRAATSPSLRTSRPCRPPWGADHRVLAFNSRGRQDPGWLCFTLEPTDEHGRQPRSQERSLAESLASLSGPLHPLTSGRLLSQEREATGSRRPARGQCPREPHLQDPRTAQGCAGQGDVPKSRPATAQAASAPKRSVGPTSGPLRRAAGCTRVFKDTRQPTAWSQGRRPPPHRVWTEALNHVLFS